MIVLGNFEVSFGVWSNISRFKQLRASFAFLSNLFKQNIGLEHISRAKKIKISKLVILQRFACLLKSLSNILINNWLKGRSARRQTE